MPVNFGAILGGLIYIVGWGTLNLKLISLASKTMKMFKNYDSMFKNVCTDKNYHFRL
jgi:hypothetical protein